MDYVVEAVGVPLRTRLRSAARRWPILRLDVGESFFVSAKEKEPRKVQYVAYAIGRMHGRRFAVRTVDRGGDYGAVICRVG